MKNLEKIKNKITNIVEPELEELVEATTKDGIDYSIFIPHHESCTHFELKDSTNGAVSGQCKALDNQTINSHYCQYCNYVVSSIKHMSTNGIIALYLIKPEENLEQLINITEAYSNGSAVFLEDMNHDLWKIPYKEFKKLKFNGYTNIKSLALKESEPLKAEYIYYA